MGSVGRVAGPVAVLSAGAAGLVGSGRLSVAVAMAAAAFGAVVALAAGIRPRQPYVAPSGLPPGPTLFIGREAEIARLTELVRPGSESSPPVAVISGESGIGKTALALVTAHRLAPAYPDGLLYARMAPEAMRAGPAGVTSAEFAVLGAFIEALQGRGASVPTDHRRLVERYCQLTARRRLLVVLDGVPVDHDVRHLVDVGQKCAVIVTAEAPPPRLATSRHLALGPLDEADSRRVLAAMVGSDRPASSGTARVPGADVADGHPLSLHILGTAIARRPHWSLDRALRDVLSGPPAPPTANMIGRRAVDIAYTLMTGLERQATQALGVLPSQAFEPWALAAAIRTCGEPDVDEDVAYRLADRLVHGKLVERLSDNEGGFPIYRTFNYVHRYARERLAGPVDLTARVAEAIDAAGAPRLRAVTLRVGETERLVDKGDISMALQRARACLAAIDRPVADVGVSVTTRARTSAHAALALIYTELGDTENAWDFARRARDGDAPLSAALVLRCIGTLQQRSQDLARAERTLVEAIEVAGRQQQPVEEVRALRELAIVQILRGDRAGAAASARRLRQYLDRSDGERLGMLARWAYGTFLVVGGHPDEAVPYLEAAHETATTTGLRLWEARIGEVRARALLRSTPARPAEARVQCLRSLEIFAAIRHRYGAAKCRLVIGRSFVADENYPAAIAVFEETLETFGNCGDRWIEATAATELATALAIDAPGRRRETRDLWNAAERTLVELGDYRSAEQVRKARARVRRRTDDSLARLGAAS